MIKTALARVGTAGLSSVLLVGLAGPASATHVDPIFVPGNPVCYDQKIEDPTSGTYGDITLVVSGSYLSFTSTTPVDSIVVKGGPNANLYDYTGLGGEFSDEGLHAPINPNNDKPYGISHICVTYGEYGGYTPPGY